MANYPQLDNARGVWNMKEVYDAVMDGYWPNALSRGVIAAGSPNVNTIDYVTISTTGDAADFGDLAEVEQQVNKGNCSSFTRGIIAGGGAGSGDNDI